MAVNYGYEFFPTNPNGLWKSISLVSIIDLQSSKGFNAIFIVVDRFTKMLLGSKPITIDSRICVRVQRKYAR